jgi:peptidyl-prolyl cis-trans isomerase A (cyclophilin A)
MKRLQLGAALGALLALPGLAVAEGDPLAGKFELAQATQGLSGTGKLMAAIETSMGTLNCELFADDAPNTVANFIGLARGLRPFREPTSGKWEKKPFYDGLVFHRVIPRFMIQGGDYTGKGSGSIGYEILDEKNGNHRFDHGGVMAMANRGPNTGTSQFFITEAPQPALDDGGRAGGHYQIFGLCGDKDVELIKKIALTPRDSDDRPLTPVKIVKVTIKREGPAGPAGAATDAPAKPTNAKKVTQPAKKAPPPG